MFIKQDESKLKTQYLPNPFQLPPYRSMTVPNRRTRCDTLYMKYHNQKLNKCVDGQSSKLDILKFINLTSTVPAEGLAQKISNFVNLFKITAKRNELLGVPHRQSQPESVNIFIASSNARRKCREISIQVFLQKKTFQKI